MIAITFNGKTQSMRKWALEIGMSEYGLRNRLQMDIPLERALDPTRLDGNYKGRPKGCKDKKPRKRRTDKRRARL